MGKVALDMSALFRVPTANAQPRVPGPPGCLFLGDPPPPTKKKNDNKPLPKEKDNNKQTVFLFCALWTPPKKKTRTHNKKAQHKGALKQKTDHLHRRFLRTQQPDPARVARVGRSRLQLPRRVPGQVPPLGGHVAPQPPPGGLPRLCLIPEVLAPRSPRFLWVTKWQPYCGWTSVRTT